MQQQSDVGMQWGAEGKGGDVRGGRGRGGGKGGGKAGGKDGNDNNISSTHIRTTATTAEERRGRGGRGARGGADGDTLHVATACVESAWCATATHSPRQPAPVSRQGTIVIGYAAPPRSLRLSLGIGSSCFSGRVYSNAQPFIACWRRYSRFSYIPVPGTTTRGAAAKSAQRHRTTLIAEPNCVPAPESGGLQRLRLVTASVQTQWRKHERK
jgi:hypothetical protein